MKSWESVESTQVFQGETAITVDDKGRLAIPTAYRELVAGECANRLVVTYSPFEMGCLWIYPYAEWETVRDQVNALPMVKASHRNLQMKLVGAASVVEPDGASRILLPASQRGAAGIEKKAVLLGMGNKFELWSEQAHLAKIRQTLGEDDITDDMADLRL
ncbi:division/cell wall cluster transcriptional repressor MraZ [Frateuria sp. MAH-13]|uniref:Transcriptional regulator MraZ n=1 Tax=Frateuria flava TaxID=2821489 RepID=A0ABS4DL37_9GAMM|nr:division/cell wall cluster transcriptional repressor MraZ [Frateuria flava]